MNLTPAGLSQNDEVKALQASIAQNDEVKRISAWAAILFAPTLVGTIYGMNFQHMPELHWAFGYPLHADDAAGIPLTVRRLQAPRLALANPPGDG